MTRDEICLMDAVIVRDINDMTKIENGMKDSKCLISGHVDFVKNAESILECNTLIPIDIRGIL